MSCPERPTESAGHSLRPVPTCCACIVRDGRLLLIQRAHEPSKGLWSFPGGRLELGETVFEAIIREVREETSLDIEPLAIFQVYVWITRDDTGRIRFHYLVNYVQCRYLSGEPHPSSDALQVHWADEADLARLPMHPFARKTALRMVRGSG